MGFEPTPKIDQQIPRCASPEAGALDRSAILPVESLKACDEKVSMYCNVCMCKQHRPLATHWPDTLIAQVIVALNSCSQYGVRST